MHHIGKKILKAFSNITKLSVVAVFMLSLTGSVLAPATVSAQVLPDQDFFCEGGECPLINPGSLEDLDREELARFIISIAQFITFIVGALAVLFVVLGGLMYTIDGGGGKRAEQGKKMAINAVIGLILSVAAFGIVSYLSQLLQSDLFGTLSN